jgi:hypothetical protein
LRFIEAFASSPMANLVEFKRVDVSARDVLIVTTGQGSEVTFGLDNFDRQLLRWQKVHEECLRYNKCIATLDLVSRGRVELGLGEGSSVTELHPFDRRFRDKRDVSVNLDPVTVLIGRSGTGKSVTSTVARAPYEFAKSQVRRRVLVTAEHAGVRRQVSQPIQRGIHLIRRTLEHSAAAGTEKRISAKQRAMTPKRNVAYRMPGHL